MRAPAPRHRLAALTAFVTLILAACASSDHSAPVVGAPPPAYTVATLSGDSVSLASLKGKVVLLNLWATWCTPCRQETPYLESVYKAHKDQGLEVVGVSLDTGDPKEVTDFVHEMGVTYTVGVDPAMRSMDLFQVLGLPASFLIDRKGILRWMRYGPVNETDRDFLNALETLLK